MMYFLLPLILIFLGLVILAIIVIRHFPQAAAIDLETLPAEQEAAMKAALMERRLKRKILDIKQKIVPVFRKIGGWFKRSGKAFHSRIAQMEQHYRRKPRILNSEQQEEVRQKIRQLLQAAREHREEEQWSEAESKYIEVLSWDYKNLDAYFGLGEVYIARKEFQQAKETLSYLLKLISTQAAGEDLPSIFSTPLTDSQITEAYYDYAVSLQLTDALQEAKRQIDIVIERDPKNPKYLDKAVELSILLKERTAAQELLDRLKTVNPDNQKLQQLDEQIRQL